MNLQEIYLDGNQLSGMHSAARSGVKTWKLCMTPGTIPVQLLRMKTQGKTVSLPRGLMLPEDIGDVGYDITILNLSNMGLIGKCAYPDP
jgi:hypothetical protein